MSRPTVERAGRIYAQSNGHAMSNDWGPEKYYSTQSSVTERYQDTTRAWFDPSLQQWVYLSSPAEAPSRALWFVLGAVTVFLGPTLLHVVGAGGRKAARAIDR